MIVLIDVLRGMAYWRGVTGNLPGMTSGAGLKPKDAQCLLPCVDMLSSCFS
ncbi:hypothetical protein ALO46_102112 [Pseudomonas syringae pv. solidagae]|uniref:Uncharacterized protein n=2 Tax=Pseudomonas syringae group TaxID=136849 RepID=A0A3M5X576_9PSED|nr:hypothetical protein ALO46_102112 [Pseudomonas syringae pv. solidagae]RMT30484.1 hypothetical protein ALP49_102133 [Pseudomonas syringae pv. solidagae]RMT44693.1 hypothetical protein ALP48_102083 [Pseudomonas syringae pv. solidagae]RMU77538.1 hypothetical protein ALP23_101812 [Pseudomonas syringae pv. apii]